MRLFFSFGGAGSKAVCCVKTGWLWVIFLLISVLAWGQSPIEISDEAEEVIFTADRLDVFVDLKNSLPFDSIASPNGQSRFTKNPLYHNQDYNPDAAYWIRLRVHHNPASQKTWMLEFYDQTIDSLDAYIPMDKGGYHVLHFGDAHPFAWREISHKNFEVVMQMKTDTVMTYYFKIYSPGFADLRLALRSIHRFIYYATNEYFLYGIFYGMILILSIYNFVTFFAIRELKYIYNIFYNLSVGLYGLTLDGIGFQYLWPNSPEWNNVSTPIAQYGVILWALIFSHRFLNLKEHALFFHRVFVWLIVVRTVWLLAALFIFPSLLYQRFIDIVPLSIIFITSIYVWRLGYEPARFFVLSYGFLFLGFFIRLLVYFNVLPFTTPLHYSLHFGFVVEMLLLTVALSDRIRLLRKDRDNAQQEIITQQTINLQLTDKVNRELEEKVRDRTLALSEKNTELENANNKITQQIFEINQINSMLDLDNWKLKNRVKEVLTEMMEEKTMSYDEFKTLYPDELSCFRLLEEMKWREGFHCLKCHNDKFFAGAKKFSRRCTRCGYNESITTDTIFHGIKFPIEKAFYITYLTATRKKDYTLESLAKLLGVGLNTVWNFKNKVEAHIKTFQAKGQRMSRWEEVLQAESRMKRVKNQG